MKFLKIGIANIWGSKSMVLPNVNLTCANFEVNKWVLSEFIISRLVPIVGIHPFPIDELFLMTAALCRKRPKHLFEWGTNIGKSARIFYEISKRFNLGTVIHSIDLPGDVFHSEHPGKRRGSLVRNIPDVNLYEGDGLDVALDICRSTVKTDTSQLFFFLDGDHSYKSVHRELSGIIDNYPISSILVHDTFYQSPESGYNVGPHDAIQFVMHDRSILHRIISTNTGLPGMTLLYRENSVPS